MPETPGSNDLADALEALADEMREYPNQPATPEEVALVRRAATAVRRLTADNARPLTCPWDARAAELQEKEGHYAYYAAWQEWFSANVDEGLPDGTGLILDDLDSCQVAYLFNAMHRLAIGEFPRKDT